MLGYTHAPLYCATSSPSTNTLSFASSSSESASFSASRTATSLTPLGVAYLLLLIVAGNESVGWMTGLMETGVVRVDERRRQAGRRRREVIIMKICLLASISDKQVAVLSFGGFDIEVGEEGSWGSKRDDAR